MYSLADVLAPGGHQARPMRHARRYRGRIGFVLDVSRHSTKLDRNRKARLLLAIEILERRTKLKGRRNGAVSIPGLTVLRALLLRFHGPSGLCCPSIDTLRRVTGLCRQSVVAGLRRLETAGVLIVTRRLVRVQDSSGTTLCRQGSNLYGFRDLSARIPLELGPKSVRLAGVHGVGTNHNPGAKPEQGLGLLECFGYEAIRKRREKMGCR